MMEFSVEDYMEMCNDFMTHLDVLEAQSHCLICLEIEEIED